MKIRFSSGIGVPAVEVSVSSLVLLTDEGDPIAAAIDSNHSVLWNTCKEADFNRFVAEQGLLQRKATKMRLKSVQEQNPSRSVH